MTERRPDDAAPEDGARFHLALRGYDRTEVDGAIKRLQREVRDLTAALEEARSAGDGPPPGPTDYDAFASEVAGVLRTAEEAAAALRTRTEAEASALIAAAREEAEQVVGQARAEAETAVADAEEDVRIVRAEAERESHRLVSAARKEAEEVLRTARMEAERLHSDATAERDRILGEAREAAEAAQSRARALEVRRDELLAELESVRATVSRLEGEIDEKRTRLETRPEPEATPAVEDVERPAETESYGSIRIIPPPEDEEDGDEDEGSMGQPVETMAMVEEVRRLHAEPPPEEPDAPIAAESAPIDAGVSAEVVDEPDDPGDVEGHPEPPVVVAEPDDDDEVAVEPPSGGALDDLFAALRGGDAGADAPAPIDDAGRAGLDESRAPEAPEPEPVIDETPPESHPPPAPSHERADRRVDAEAAIEERDRRLIPITNGALRGVKRELADAQNHALEGLRTDPEGWRPSRAELSEHFEPSLVLVRDAARRAGIEWALGHLGVEATVGGRPSADTSALAGDLAASIERALTRGADGQARSAEVSRVFRSWRSDTAERHLRTEAGRAYHEGVRDAADAAGHRVTLEVVRACPACAEAAEADEVTLPPVHDGCRCVLVPL